jgi:hypothetical protein
MGYWNDGILEYWVWRNGIYFYLDGPQQNLKSGQHPLFIPNIPFFQHSIIPQLHVTGIKPVSLCAA